MEGKVHGKQIIKDTVLRSLNGSPGSTQYLIPNSDDNITLDIISPTDSSTHSFVVGWQGYLPLERGGLNNGNFNNDEILVTTINSVISSGYKFNDTGVSDKDIWSAEKVINYYKSNLINKEIPQGVLDGVNKDFTLSNDIVLDSEHVYLNGLLQDNGDDYVINGNVITFDLAPLPGSKIRCSYIVLSSALI